MSEERRNKDSALHIQASSLHNALGLWKPPETKGTRQVHCLVPFKLYVQEPQGLSADKAQVQTMGQVLTALGPRHDRTNPGAIR